MTDSITSDDRDRVRDEYTDAEDALSRDEIEEDLDSAGFEGSSKDAFAETIAGAEDLAASEDDLRRAQREAISNVKSGGAIGGQVLQGKDPESGRNKSIGKPGNVTQEIERTGPRSGRVIAENKNTGTRGIVGEIELAPAPGT